MSQLVVLALGARNENIKKRRCSVTFGYVIGLATVNIHRSNKAVLLLGNRFTAEPLRIGFSIFDTLRAGSDDDV